MAVPVPLKKIEMTGGYKTLEHLSSLSDKGSASLAKELVIHLGNLAQYKVTKNYVLVGLYIGGSKIAGSNLFRSDNSKLEDVFQSNCGLVIKLGPSAFKNNDGTDEPDPPLVGEWIYYRGGHQRLQINGVNYAFLHENDIVGTVPDPATITHRR